VPAPRGPLNDLRCKGKSCPAEENVEAIGQLFNTTGKELDERVANLVALMMPISAGRKS
ncbi:unnamed protein product, partial [Musa hybrid cultivar]